MSLSHLSYQALEVEIRIGEENAQTIQDCFFHEQVFIKGTGGVIHLECSEFCQVQRIGKVQSEESRSLVKKVKVVVEFQKVKDVSRQRRQSISLKDVEAQCEGNFKTRLCLLLLDDSLGFPVSSVFLTDVCIFRHYY